MNLIYRLIARIQGVKAWKDGNWYFRAKKYFSQQNGVRFSYFCVWCSHSPLTGKALIFENPEREIYFEYADTIENAVSKLKKEIGFNERQ